MCKPEVTSSPSRSIDKPLMSPPSLRFYSQKSSHLSIPNPTLSKDVVVKMSRPAFPSSLTVRTGPPTQ